MKEKFSDFESVGYIKEEGEFEFEIKSYELKDGQKGQTAVFEVESNKGKSTIYHSLNPKARWSYNNLIKACLHLNTDEKIKSFECDYETIGRDLVGKTFIGSVKAEPYEKLVKKPLDDGTFDEVTETRTSYKIKSYREA